MFDGTCFQEASILVLGPERGPVKTNSEKRTMRSRPGAVDGIDVEREAESRTVSLEASAPNMSNTRTETFQNE
jgi:hypothetical protein